MATKKTKNIAVGSFILAANKLSDKRGGKQKLVKIAPDLFYFGKIKGSFFYSNKIPSATVARLNKLTQEIKSLT